MSQVKFILEMHESIGGEKSYDILTCAENAFDKIQNLFLIKKATLKKWKINKIESPEIDLNIQW